MRYHIAISVEGCGSRPCWAAYIPSGSLGFWLFRRRSDGQFIGRGGLKTYEVLNPDDFDAAVRIAQAEFDHHQPDVVVGSSRGGAVAMHIDSGDTPLVLLCPAWKRWGKATTVKAGTIILHSQADDTVPFADSVELVRNSGLPSGSLIVVGQEHRLADEESLRAMVEAVESAAVICRAATPDLSDSRT